MKDRFDMMIERALNLEKEIKNKRQNLNFRECEKIRDYQFNLFNNAGHMLLDELDRLLKDRKRSSRT